MKNLQAFVTPHEVRTQIYGLWQTPGFREQQLTPGSLVHRVTEQYTLLPRLFAEMTNEHLEKSHFSSWWNVMMLRDYSNPVIHDLYLLHEMHHAGTMPYLAGINKKAFDEKMQRNELEASVLSEIEIYFDMPGLREQSFDHPIYADRFLESPTMQSLWKHDRRTAVETIRTVRRDLMSRPSPEGMDDMEFWIRQFAEQNQIYSLVWSDRYNEVETVGAALRSLSCIDRHAAITRHKEWLEREAAKDTQDNIPFRAEAELFAAHYWANKAKYDAAHKV